jgi:hydrogenase nickel incorporation protein HypA/HybF
LFVMNMQDLIVKCQDCNKQFTLKQNDFICPTCKGSLEVIDGEEMYLMRLEME